MILRRYLYNDNKSITSGLKFFTAGVQWTAYPTPAGSWEFSKLPVRQ